MDKYLLALFASNGLWGLITWWLSTRKSKISAESKMIRGLAHDRILHLGLCYIERGYISAEEYKNIYNYLYIPYTKLGGNGAAQKVMDEVKELPIKGEVEHVCKFMS